MDERMPNLKVIGSALILSSCGLSGSQPAGYESQINLAEQLLKNNNYDRAYAVYDDVSQRNDRSSTVQLALAESYFENRAFLKSEQSLSNARALGAETEANLGLGRISLAKNDPTLAISYFEAVLSDDPENIPALNGLGVANDMTGNHSSAQTYYRQILETSPGSLDTQSNLGLSLILSGEIEEATLLLSDLAASDLNNPVVRQNLALSYHALGRNEEAMKLATVDVSEEEATSLFNSVQQYRRAIP